MARKSTIRRLHRDIRDQIGVLLDQGRTLDEIRDHLTQLGAEVSRSALGRYKKHIDKVSERIRRSREVAEALVRNFGEEPEGKTARLNIELLHSVLNDMLMQIPSPGEDGEDEDGPLVELDPKGAMLLAKAVDHLAKAKKSDADLLSKLKEQARKEAAQAVKKVADKFGVSDEAKRAIRAELGVTE